MAKKKTKKSKIEKIQVKARGVSAPEYFLFGFIISTALVFSFFCLLGAGNIPTSFPMAKASSEKVIFEKKIRSLVSGYPIEKMSPYISRRNEKVASFLVAIAKKESNWGRHSPKKNGQECFNYWGYRGPENPTASGYSCFDSPRHAVNVVGGRISDLVAKKIDTPREMVLWKCGSTSCARNDRGAAKWIWDVESYYKKIYPYENKISYKQKQTAMSPKTSL